MKPEDFSKVFDVSKPRPSATSRPIIVGHRPEMPDPMMRRPQAPAKPQHIRPPKQQHGDSVQFQQARSIPVTQEMREEIVHARTPLANMDPKALEENSIPSAPAAVPAQETVPEQTAFHAEQEQTPSADVGQPQITHPTEQEPPVIAPQEQVAEPAEQEHTPSADVGQPQIIHPNEQETPAAPSPDVFNAPTVTMAPQNQSASEPHYHSVPVSHHSVAGPGVIRRLAVWLIVLAVLAVIGLYLITDAGLISNSVNLPFHIFNQQT